ncbi:MAG TPA: flagellar biosynthesis regulator FlaF, partial [Arenibaculum sp.]|nr:flagellar biosynthesis regulator FlaF [Arenibaculum sp.]
RKASRMKTDFRSQEANLFKRVTYGLIQGKEKKDGMDLVRAASDDKRLWMTVVQLLSDDQNQLPAPLRAQMISIGQAVIKEIDDNINGDLDVDFLIDINNQIIEGLSGAAAAADVADAASPMGLGPAKPVGSTA